MKRMIKFPSINQLRNVVHTVVSRSQYAGKSDDGTPIFDTTKALPKLTFQGTVKLHGTNAAVAKNGDDMWCQSRENIITIQSDNAGFATWVHGQNVFLSLFDAIGEVVETGPEDTLMIFGEWCGGGIQKSVGLNQLPKMFVIFGMAVVSPETRIPNGPDNFQVHSEKRWIEPAIVQGIVDHVRSLDYVFFPPALKCIYDFDTYLMEIDFARPHEAQAKLVELTLAVEQECPVSKALGAVPNADGKIIGEGIVWKCLDPDYQDSGYWFKVKGEEHSPKTKVKTLAAADVQRIDSINELADTLCPHWRLEQMYQQTFDTLNGGKGDVKRTGDFIKAVMTDICKEEADTLSASGYTSKEINGRVSKHVRDYLFTQLNADVGIS